MATNVSITDLSFDTIKTNFKQFLTDKGYFQDYNFEGSGLSILMDLLAYNTYYMAFYGNMIANEMFLDSAQQRGSVVSRAKELNYLPKSEQASCALLRVTFVPVGSPNPAVIEKNTKFQATLDGTTYQFTTIVPVNVAPVDGIYQADILVYQGALLSNTYTVNLSDPLQRFVIPNANADIRFLSVKVKSDINATTEKTYIFADNIVAESVGADSEIYYLQETYNGYYEVLFGDGVLGKALENGNIITIEYLVTDGKDANGINVFSRVGTVAGSTNVSIQTVNGSFGGNDKEDIESIRALAPRFYQTQNRAVTVKDYVALVKSRYGQISDCIVWGGEDNKPYPYYGRVFLSVQPNTGIVLSDTVKTQIANEIKSLYGVLTVTPSIVDPDYTYANVAVEASYNQKTLGITTTALQTLLNTTITTTFDATKNLFNKDVLVAQLYKDLVLADTSILGVNLKFQLEKQVAISTTTNTEYDIDFANPLVPNSIDSSDFYFGSVLCHLKDVPVSTKPYTTGTIEVVDANDNVIYPNIGTVDYTTGLMIITTKPTAIVGNYVSITANAIPQETEVNKTPIENILTTNGRNQIILLGTVGTTLLPKSV